MQCSMVIHEVLSTTDFTVDGQARAMITSITNPGTSTHASLEVNFIAGGHTVRRTNTLSSAQECRTSLHSADTLVKKVMLKGLL